MKIPKAVKLPSGSWYINIMIDGKRLSITAPTKREAENEAAAIKSGAKAAKIKTKFTVGEVIDRYISSKDTVLSPTTINGYKKLRKSVFQEIMDDPADSISQERVQRAVNKMARSKSPKYVRNAYGLFTAAMAEYFPDRMFRITLPQKEAPKIQIPTMDQIRTLHEDCRGKQFELPFLLAVWLGLRTSEIRGLTWDCIDGNTLIIKQALVEGENGPELKQPKTYSGNRRLQIPPYIMHLLEKTPRIGIPPAIGAPDAGAPVSITGVVAALKHLNFVGVFDGTGNIPDGIQISSIYAALLSGFIVEIVQFLAQHLPQIIIISHSPSPFTTHGQQSGWSWQS